jgi:hypothetical protein
MKIFGEFAPEPPLWQLLGDRVVRRPPALPEWQPLAHAPYIEINRQGQLRTKLPLPKEE